ncbi:MAG: hypothetical protein WCO56_29410 [Verrucomicrobiota bacterium]
MHNLYPVIRRKRRPLMPPNAAPAAPEMPGSRLPQADAAAPVLVQPPPVLSAGKKGKRNETPNGKK